ncbi:hypothetical protein GCM10008026_03390 [Chelatococcus composti]|nr:hypothetical protein GCM10008026_03390 [Chelatococcus composti]
MAWTIASATISPRERGRQAQVEKRPSFGGLSDARIIPPVVQFVSVSRRRMNADRGSMLAARAGAPQTPRRMQAHVSDGVRASGRRRDDEPDA